MFRHLVLARIIEPSSKLDSLPGPGGGRGWAPLRSYRTHARAGCPAYARGGVPASSCLRRARRTPGSAASWCSTTSTSYFETDRVRFREPGFSRERLLEPQITIGLLDRRRTGSRS